MLKPNTERDISKSGEIRIFQGLANHPDANNALLLGSTRVCIPLGTRHCILTRRTTGVNKRTSKATWQAFYSMDGPFAISNLILLGALILIAVLRPNLDDPNTHWTLAVVAVLFLVAGGFKVQGVLRLKSVHKSAKEDRRRIAEGLPLDPDERERQRDTST